jgi:hypothetical protein
MQPREIRLYAKMFDQPQQLAVYGARARALVTRAQAELSAEDGMPDKDCQLLVGRALTQFWLDVGDAGSRRRVVGPDQKEVRGP